MAINKLLVIGGTTLVLGLASVAGAGVVSAQSSTAANGSTSIVDKIAQKFNLKSADVQKVFDEDKAAHDAQRQADMKTKLDQAVKDGKITADQETKLIAKLAEMDKTRDANRTANQALTGTQRKAAMDKERTDFEAWLTANGISKDVLPQGGMHGGPRGGMGGSRGDRDGDGLKTATSAPSSTTTN